MESANPVSEFLDAATILAADDRVFEDIPCPEWTPAGSDVRKVRIVSLSSVDRDEWEKSLVKTKPGKGGKLVPYTDTSNMRAKLVAKCAVNGAFTPIFTEAQVVALGKKNSAVVDRLYEAAQRLSKLSEADVEELVGNSEDDPSQSS
jgi:hypothetical protein